MSKTSFISVLIIILTLAAIIFFGYHPSSRTPSPAVSSTLSVSSQTINESNSKYTTHAEYPVIAGLASSTGADTINADIKNAVDGDISNFKDNIVPPAESAIPAQAGQSNLTLAYATMTLGTLFDVKITQEFYSAGAAHPGHQIDTYTYDTQTGKRLSLDDLFTGNYLQTFSTISRDLLTKQLTENLGTAPDTTMLNQGTEPTADNFSAFLPERDGLHLIFNEYQVGPYVIGSPEIVIPWKKLAAVINPAGPLASFAK